MNWTPIKDKENLPPIFEYRFLTIQKSSTVRAVVLGYFAGLTPQQEPIYRLVGSTITIKEPVLAHANLPEPWNG